MPLTAQLAKLPPVLLLLLIVLGCNVVSIVGLLIFRRFTTFLRLKDHIHLVGYSLAIVGVIYGLLLSVAVTSVCNTMRDAEEQAQEEGSSIFLLVTTLQTNADISGVPAVAAQLKKYMQFVINREYPAMKQLKKDPITSEAFVKLFLMVQKIEPTNAAQRQTLDHIQDILDDLSKIRALRLHRMNVQLPVIFWVLIIGGSIATLALIWFLGADSISIHILICIGFTTLLGIIIFLILELEYPYIGYPAVKPEGYKSVLEMADGFMRHRYRAEESSAYLAG